MRYQTVNLRTLAQVVTPVSSDLTTTVLAVVETAGVAAVNIRQTWFVVAKAIRNASPDLIVATLGSDAISAVSIQTQRVAVVNHSQLEAIGQRYRIPIISAISVRDASDLTLASLLEEISAHVLFDAKTPGSGKPFDWRLLKNLPLKKKWFLAGGLTPENVAEAIRITHAPMVDVSSGIEDQPGSGNKSLEKIASFNAAVLNAHA